MFSCSKIEQKQLNTWVSFQSAEQPLLGQFSVSGNIYQVPIAVKPSIQTRIAFHGVTLSRNHGFGTLVSNLHPYGLAVITLVRMIVCAEETLAIKVGACVQSLVWPLVISTRAARRRLQPGESCWCCLPGFSRLPDPYRRQPQHCAGCSFGIATIDENPFHIWLSHKRLKYLEPFARRRPRIEALVDLTPASKCLGQDSPGTTCAHALQHGFDGHS